MIWLLDLTDIVEHISNNTAEYTFFSWLDGTSAKTDNILSQRIFFKNLHTHVILNIFSDHNTIKL